MAKINLPPGCAGFADGDQKFMAERGVGSYVNITDERQLKKLRSQDYAAAGLVDAGPQKEFVNDKRQQGRWCRTCNRLWHSWVKICSKCGNETLPEADMEKPLREGHYIP